MKYKKLFRKAGVLAIVSAITLSLSGCTSNGDITWETICNYTDGGEDTFNYIRDRNLKVIDDLYNAGFLTKQERDEMKKSLEDKVSSLTNAVESGRNRKISNNIVNTFIDAITTESIAEAADLALGRSAAHVFFDENGKFVEYDVNDFNNNYNTQHSGGCSRKKFEDPENNRGGLWVPKTCTNEVGEGENKHECGQTYYVAAEDQTIFDKVIENVAKCKDNGANGGRSFALFDASIASTLVDNLGRNIYVINKFDDINHKPEHLQLTLAILKEEKDRAEQIMKDNSLSDATLGTNTKASVLVNKIGSIDNNTKSKLEQYLLSFGELAKDESGNNIVYLNVVADAGGQKRKDDNGFVSVFAETWASDNSMTESGTDTKLGSVGVENRLGVDFCLSTDHRVSMRVRLKEFNPNLVSELSGAVAGEDGPTGIKGQYYLTQYINDTNSKVAVKLDYPLYKIEEIRTAGLDQTDWWTVIAPTELSMSALDGTMFDSNGVSMPKNGEGFNYDGCSMKFWPYDYVNMKDPSSAKVSVNIKEINGTMVKAFCRPIVLTDYTELYYIRDTDDKGLYTDLDANDNPEYWAALGRRMRVNKFSGGSGDDTNRFAVSLNRDGSKSDNYISLTKVIDRTSGDQDHEGLAEALGLGKSNGTDSSSGANSGIYGSGTNFGLKQDYYYDYINPVILLGTEGTHYPLAQNDYANVNTRAAGTNSTYTCPTTYGMCLSLDLKENNLVGGDWINGKSSECQGLIEWNKWLEDNKFVYRIDIDRLLDMLDISIDVTEEKEKAITFNPDIIEHIQNGEKELQDYSITRLIKTLTKIFGVILNAYAILLVAAWLIDVNVYGGPRLLNKMTLGRWEAIHDEDDIPMHSGKDDEIFYMDKKHILMAMIAIMAVGITLLMFDFTDLARYFRWLFSGIIETLKNILIYS